MRRKLLEAGFLLAILAGTAGCSVLRPVLFWRAPTIMGQAQLMDTEGAPLTDAQPGGVILNFINRDGRIEDSIQSVKTDETGYYTSPELMPGEYTVEAMLPGFAIAKETVLVRNHEYRYVDFTLQKIRESVGRSMREAQEDNIPHAGEVQIAPPPF